MRTLLAFSFLLSAISLAAQDPNDTTRLGKFLFRHSYLRCYPMYEDPQIGIRYGAVHHMPGIVVNDFWSNLNLVSDIDWRLPTNRNTYFQSSFIKFLNTRLQRCEFVTTGYKHIKLDHFFSTKQIFIGGGLYHKGYRLALAYARQQMELFEYRVPHNNGVMLNIYRQYMNKFEVYVTGLYWFDQFQYSVRVKQDIQHSGFYVGIGYEKTGPWEEFDISVLYRYPW